MTNHDKPWQTMTNHDKPKWWFDLHLRSWVSEVKAPWPWPLWKDLVQRSSWSQAPCLAVIGFGVCVKMLTVSSKRPFQHEENLFRRLLMKLFRTWRFYVFVISIFFGPWKCYPPRPEDHKGSEIAARIPLYAALRSSECLDLQKTLRLAGSPPLSNCHAGTHRIHVWYIYLHLGHLWGKCW